jgi:hypothetical protein
MKGAACRAGAVHGVNQLRSYIMRNSSGSGGTRQARDCVIMVSWLTALFAARWGLQVEAARGSLNQIPPHCTWSGDIRLTPFYDMVDVRRKVEG